MSIKCQLITWRKGAGPLSSLGYRKKQTKKDKKKGNVCQGHLISPGFLHTDRSGYLVGFEVYALKQREEEMWPFQLYIKEVYGRRSGRTTPAAQPSTLHLGFLPADCTAAMEEITVAGGTQRIKITTATDTIYWILESRGWGAWWAAIYGVAPSRTRLKRLSSSSSTLVTSLLLGIFTPIIFIPHHL